MSSFGKNLQKWFWLPVSVYHMRSQRHRWVWLFTAEVDLRKCYSKKILELGNNGHWPGEEDFVPTPQNFGGGLTIVSKGNAITKRTIQLELQK